MEAKASKEFLNSAALFKSVDKDLTTEYLEFFTNMFGTFVEAYQRSQPDGTEDALKLRMLASMRLAQFGLSLFSFFSSSAMSIRAGDADSEACNATSRVVSMTVESAVDKWISKAKAGQN